MRLYKKTYNLRQICNIAVYMIHSACTIHLLNLPEKTAKRDIIHGIKHLEEMAEDWLSGRRTLSILSVLARKWNVELPEEAAMVLQRTDEKYGYFNTADVPSPNRSITSMSPPTYPTSPPTTTKQEQYSPANYSNQPTPPQMQDIPSGSLSPDFLSGLGTMAPPSNVQPQTVKPGAQGISSPGMTMGDPYGNMSSWSMPQVSQPMPRYHQSYAPVQNNVTSASTSQSATRQVTPNSLYTIDGQDWFLKDGANWQQNFESWGGSTDMNNQNMFMFKGLPTNDVDSSFDFNNSMSNLDQLPGLD